MTRYGTQEEVQLYDRIEYSGQPGKIMAVADSSCYDPQFDKGVWEEELGKGGILIQFDNGALLSLDLLKKDEMLRFIKRAGPA